MTISSDVELALMAPFTRTCGFINGQLNIQNVSNATLLAEAFPNLRVVADYFSIYENPNLATLDGTFPNLQTVSENFGIGSSNATSFDGIFPNLRSVGGTFTIAGHPNLASIDGSFPNLRTVGSGPRAPILWPLFSGPGTFGIRHNPLLMSIGSSFGSLQTVDTLHWYGNGGQTYTYACSSTGTCTAQDLASTPGSVAFCASAVGTLCPTTTSWANNDPADDAYACCTAYCATTTNC